MPANSWSSVRNIHSWRLRIWKKNSLCNLINQQPDIDEIYFYTQDPYEAKYQLLIRKREYVATKHLNHYKAFIKYWNNKRDIYKNIEDYNPNKKQKILIVFDDMIANMLSNTKLNSIVTEWFIRGTKLNISLVFVRLNSGDYFIMKISNKKELQQIVDTTLVSDNLSRFRKNLLERIEKSIMTIDDELKVEKLQYDINREAAKISSLSSEYEFLRGEKILPPDQRSVIEQSKFAYSSLE